MERIKLHETIKALAFSVESDFPAVSSVLHVLAGCILMETEIYLWQEIKPWTLETLKHLVLDRGH